ncbi:MAG: hypothetical protein EAZ90_19630 [Oscillatoriales cyanobacterium]|nr:MAG: hypothetical protein EAZ94_24285 [Oscillatoriales cyanobacterium]TAE20123.1 MAG: hypothetical protein EAZ93_25430 [Oscillatoriales cyanobacterium]TAE40762.1 MAG: hypothetical protein EAZ90_19630 [Oscillatoriales cyanobacterium]TAE51214.1 MAG: hypothetical protein EAZ88_18670 [Oscillatoriales cyanobacterium]TAE68116.1 MAG: hypothetical protein EAZ86_14570 [Oscillatoriales cyanobacterium]
MMMGSISVLHLIVRASPLASPAILASGDARTTIKNIFCNNEMLPDDVWYQQPIGSESLVC